MSNNLQLRAILLQILRTRVDQDGVHWTKSKRLVTHLTCAKPCSRLGWLINRIFIFSVSGLPTAAVPGEAAGRRGACHRFDAVYFLVNLRDTKPETRTPEPRHKH
jgi:hypothetical protein